MKRQRYSGRHRHGGIGGLFADLVFLCIRHESVPYQLLPE